MDVRNGGNEIDASPTQSAGEDSTNRAKPREPWVRYRVEYRDVKTDVLIDFRDTIDPEEEIADRSGIDEPIFEMVTVCQARRGVGDEDSDKAEGQFLALNQKKHLNLYSTSIINALRSVVKYYPSQDLAGNPVRIHYPYAVLVHHYDELSVFRDACAAKSPGEMCVREISAERHLRSLLKFLDDHIMKDVRAEMERINRGVYTWELAWVHYKPGSTVIRKSPDEENRWEASVIHSVHGGIFQNPQKDWRIQCWSLECHGDFVIRGSDIFYCWKFDGEATDIPNVFESNPDFVQSAADSPLLSTIVDKINCGKTYYQLLRKQCKGYKGRALKPPHNQVDGLVMVDVFDFDYLDSAGLLARKQVDSSDLRVFVSDCTCSSCKDRADNTSSKVVALFENYSMTTLDEDKLDDHQYLLFPVTMPAFVFKIRQWETLHVRGFTEPDFQEDMIQGLVMDERRKDMLKALARSFARKNRFGQELTQDMWSADFVRGKGSGLVFLLHGKPGVGKTCTAECISAFTRRPLMVMTAGDIGTDPNEVEKNLEETFERATRWDAVLLIDEADVFMERRTTSDLVRNSLVAGFLRALENYTGILFLTTNRVGSFDDAFISRVHIQLYYPEFTEDQRQQVWKTFMDKLARERGDYIRLNIDAKEYIRGSEMRAVKWNGREIRNAFQTAVAMAEYDAEKDEEGKIVVTDSHLRAVVDLSRDFKDYLQILHRGDESKRAERKSERLDTYGIPGQG